MTDDWSGWPQVAGTKPDQQLEIEAEKANDVGGSAEIRAIARVEIKRREREAAETLATKHLAIAERQAQAAKWAAVASWGSVAVTLIVGLPPLLSRIMH